MWFDKITIATRKNKSKWRNDKFDQNKIDHDLRKAHFLIHELPENQNDLLYATQHEKSALRARMMHFEQMERQLKKDDTEPMQQLAAPGADTGLGNNITREEVQQAEAADEMEGHLEECQDH